MYIFRILIHLCLYPLGLYFVVTHNILFGTSISSTPFPDLDVCKVCLKKQDGLFHPMNILRVKALDAAFESAIDVGSWEDAKRLGEEVEPGYR